MNKIKIIAAICIIFSSVISRPPIVIFSPDNYNVRYQETITQPALNTFDYRKRQADQQFYLMMLRYVNSSEYQQALQEQAKKRSEEIAQYKKYYGVSEQDLYGTSHTKGLYQLSFQELSKKLLTSGDLTKEQACHIWQGYAQKRSRIFDEQKKLGLETIEDGYDIKEYVHLVKNREVLRDEAKNKTLQSHHEKLIKSYVLSAQTCGFMMAYGLQPMDFMELTGTHEQHHKIGRAHV